MMVAMSEAVVYLLCGAIVALTAGCVAAFASAARSCKPPIAGPGRSSLQWVI